MVCQTMEIVSTFLRMWNDCTVILYVFELVIAKKLAAIS